MPGLENRRNTTWQEKRKWKIGDDMVLKIHGGLGNQLFLYALYRKYQKMGIKVYGDMHAFDAPYEMRRYELSKLGISMEHWRWEKVFAPFFDSNAIGIRILRKLLKGSWIYEEQDYLNFEEAVLHFKHKYLIGYFQTEKYFEDIDAELRQEIRIQEPTDAQNQNLLQQIRQTSSVSIHVRLGDYLSNQDLYGGICTKAYYQKAINKIKEVVKEPVFFVFSDTIEQAKELFDLSEKVVMVDCNQGGKSYLDMYLMSQCKHHILANSSFSWWAAWMDDKKEAKIIAPDKWINDHEVKDAWRKDWIKI